ncbi:DUF4292 domain-containing protein [bacterium]|nr:DUF4292 domain-containing protein [bacterium]
MRRTAATLLLLLLASAGCSSLITARKPLDPNADPADVIGSVAANLRRVQTFSGGGLLTLSSAEGSQRAMLSVQLKRPDSLHFKIEGPLGLDLLAGSIGGDSMHVVSSSDNMLYRGRPEQLGDIIVLPGDPELSDLISLFMGLQAVHADAARIQSFWIDGDAFRAEYPSGETVYIDPAVRAVTGREIPDGLGRPAVKLEMSQFRKRKGVFMPHLIRLTGFQPLQRLTVYYERMRPNVKLDRTWFDLSIPKGVTIVDL